MENYDIITIGGAVQDFIFYTDEGKVLENPDPNPLVKKILGFEAGAKIYVKDVSFFAGGGALNTGAGFSKLGIKTAAITRIGDDQNGKRLVEKMKQRGISTQLVQKDKEHPTAFSFIPSLKKEKVHSIFTHHGAVDYLQFPKKAKKKIKTDWFYISSLSSPKWPDIIKKVFKFKNKIGANLAWNPSNIQIKDEYEDLKKFLKDLEVLILNEDEARELVSHETSIKDFKVEELLKEICKLGPDIVAITCGKEGAYACDGKQVFFQKAKKVEVKNTTGAGDAFSSGFVGSLSLEKNNLKRALLWGIIESAAVISVDGAQNGLLNRKEIEKESKQV